MEIKHRFENVIGNINLDELEIISVASKKNATVSLCIKANMNIPFAKIKLYSRDKFVDAEACFESAEVIGKEIERRWQLQAELDKHRWIPVSEKLPEESGAYLVMLNYLHPRNLSIKMRHPAVESFFHDDAMWGTEKAITHWKPIILPDQALQGTGRKDK